MTDIKMSEVFEIIMSSDVVKDHFNMNAKEWDKNVMRAITAINAYDDNQERIDSLTHESALLENQLKNAQAEIAELKKKAQGY
mgnify:CR=1 FL=1